MNKGIVKALVPFLSKDSMREALACFHCTNSYIEATDAFMIARVYGKTDFDDCLINIHELRTSKNLSRFPNNIDSIIAKSLGRVRNGNTEKVAWNDNKLEFIATITTIISSNDRKYSSVDAKKLGHCHKLTAAVLKSIPGMDGYAVEITVEEDRIVFNIDGLLFIASMLIRK